jgi:Uma2 family endonuclease
MPTKTPRRVVRTLADQLRRLGNVPPHRILWQPFPGTATEADALCTVNSKNHHSAELIDGILVEKAMGIRESFLAMWLGTLLNNFVIPRKLGLVAGADGICRLFPNQLRIPDVSFTTWARLPNDNAHLQQIADWTPDLCVEVLSESNTQREMQRKRRDYFRGGAKLVWEVHPIEETVTVYETDPSHGIVLTKEDVLTGGDVLPEFTLKLAEFFAQPVLQPRPPG